MSFDSESQALWLLCAPDSSIHLTLIYFGGVLAGAVGWMYETRFGLDWRVKKFLSSLLGRQAQPRSPYWTSNNLPPGPIRVGAAAQGASAAVSAMVATFAFLMPKAYIRMMPFPVPVRAWVGLIMFVGIDAFGLDLLGMENKGMSIAHSSHLAGTAFGALYSMAVLWRKLKHSWW